MEDFLKEAIKQVPSLAVLAWVVYVFLGHIRTANESRAATEKASADERAAERKSREDADAARAVLLKAMGDSCHEFQRGVKTDVDRVLERSYTSINASAQALAVITPILERVARHFEDEDRKKPK